MVGSLLTGFPGSGMWYRTRFQSPFGFMSSSVAVMLGTDGCLTFWLVPWAWSCLVCSASACVPILSSCAFSLLSVLTVLRCGLQFEDHSQTENSLEEQWASRQIYRAHADFAP